ncbi:uncharacterized protein AKAW2_50833A [Aspergillus luchuensis]|uniref:Uncharacterized protein n=1 Tax=Aspergillus kawachii TaxID=1069201 RepID=A0A7R8A0M0_ASPKA|nr:uncharacterized protein AKAW2_50833A [Aspergillus luchuensis]BCS00492.1 hypothetical protein AKAW2_50833A [Aspergillus luchuensis]
MVSLLSNDEFTCFYLGVIGDYLRIQTIQEDHPIAAVLHANNRNKGGNKHPDATSQVRVLNAPGSVANRAEGALSQRQRLTFNTTPNPHKFNCRGHSYDTFIQI